MKMEEAINDHTRMLTKAMNIGENHNHLSRVLASKINTSENTVYDDFVTCVKLKCPK